VESERKIEIKEKLCLHAYANLLIAKADLKYKFTAV